MRFIIVNGNGKIVRTVQCVVEHAAVQAQQNETILPHATADISTHYVRNGKVKLIPPAPSTWHDWDGAKWTDLRSRDEIGAAIRDRRAQLLTSSDWSMLPDSPLSDEAKENWKQYRQRLRDITNEAQYPHAVTWPDLPSSR